MTDNHEDNGKNAAPSLDNDADAVAKADEAADDAKSDDSNAAEAEGAAATVRDDSPTMEASCDTTEFGVAEVPRVFADLTPIAQDDGPIPVCAIAYSVEFRTVMDYLRALLARNEISPRAWHLTTLALQLNAANYTVWHYRRRQDLQVPSELDFCQVLGGSNPKNYQIWYHRRAMLERAFGSSQNDHNDDENAQQAAKEATARQELAYIQTVLEEDAKNYHAWSLRQWVLKTVHCPLLWKEEERYLESLLEEDLRNNSAWNQRWFVLHQSQNPMPRRDEVAFTLTEIQRDVHNESSWRYLVGLLKEQQDLIPDALQQLDQWLPTWEPPHYSSSSSSSSSNKPYAPTMWSSMVDILQLRGDVSSLQRALDLTQILEDEQDVIRTKYWNMRREELQQEIERQVEE